MLLWPLLILAAAADLPAAEIVTLKGERQAGQLVELTDSGATLRTEAGELQVPLAGVLEIGFPSATVPEASSGARVALADGTRLTAEKFWVSKDQAHLETAQCGALTLPVSRIASVRFGISTAKLDEAWDALVQRKSKDDLLIVRKDDVLDFLAGVAGEVEEKITFLIDGDEVPVAREKTYGIIYRRRNPPAPKTACQVRLAGGDLLQAGRVAFDGQSMNVRLAAGPEVRAPASAVAALDFSFGKLQYLSEMEPRDVKYVPFWDLMLYEYRRDRSLDGPPITLAGKSYARGLAMHSRTQLRYRIGGEFARFQAVAGIDDTVRSLKRQVRLVISGDGRVLFEGEISGKDPPRPLDLDVAGVRDLSILCDFGADMTDEADHLDLADAKLIK